MRELTGMDNVHPSHGTSSIIEYPLLIKIDIPCRELVAQLFGNVGHDSGGVVTMSPNGTQREIMKVRRIEDIKPVEM